MTTTHVPKHRAEGDAIEGDLESAIKGIVYGELKHFLDDVEFRLGQTREIERRIASGTGSEIKTVYAEDLNLLQHQLTGYTVTANTPGAGSIAWTNVHVVYNGVDYTCADGSTALRYVTFVKPASGTTATLVSSATKPTLAPGDTLVFVNEGGTPQTAVGASIPVAVANNAIDASAILAGAVGTAALADDAVNSAKIAANAVTSTELNTGAVTDTKIATDAVTATKIATGAVIDTKLATGAVTSTKIGLDAVTTAAIAPNAVTDTELNAGAVTTTKIALDAVTNAAIAPNAVTDTELNTGAVTSTKIAGGAVGTAAIANDAIDSTKIALGAVGTTEIANGAVTATTIGAGAITPVKLNTLQHVIF